MTAEGEIGGIRDMQGGTMGSGKVDIDALVKDVLVEDALAERRRAAEDHPKISELIAYHDRTLTDGAKEAVRDHLTKCPECTRLILDRTRFADPEPSREGSRDEVFQGTEDFKEFKHALKVRISEKEVRKAEREKEESAQVLAFSSRLEQFSSPAPPAVKVVASWWSMAAAAALLAVAFGAGWWMRGLGVTGPASPGAVERAMAKNHKIVSLLPLGEGSRGIVEPSRVQPAPHRPLLLLLTYFKDETVHGDYRIEILDEVDRSLWRVDGFQPSERQFALDFPPELSRQGSYQLHLHGLTEGRSRLLARYAMIFANALPPNEVPLEGGTP